jgi:hypothetical protein
MIERPVLLHDEDEVIELEDPAVSARRVRRVGGGRVDLRGVGGVGRSASGDGCDEDDDRRADQPGLPHGGHSQGVGSRM